MFPRLNASLHRTAPLRSNRAPLLVFDMPGIIHVDVYRLPSRYAVFRVVLIFGGLTSVLTAGELWRPWR